MQFFRTVFSVCTGTSEYPELIKRNPFRAVFHLFLLSVLLTLVIAGFRFADLREVRETVSKGLSDYFCNIVIKDGFAYPEKHAVWQKTFILTRSLRLDYLPDSANGLEKMDQWLEAAGIIWTPRGFLVWGRIANEKGKYVLIPLPMPSASVISVLPQSVSTEPVSSQEIKSYVQKNYYGSEKKADSKEKPLVLSVSQIVSTVFNVYSMFIAAAAFFELFLTSLMITLLFAATQNIFAPKTENKLHFPRLMSMMVYAAFPPLVIASFFSALSLPFFSFQTVFFIAFFICQIMAYSAVQRHLNPRPPQQTDDEDFY